LTSKERVQNALTFRRPDRIPIYDEFSPEWARKWRQEKGLGPDADPADYYGVDMYVLTADETPFPSRRGVIGTDGGATLERTGWGDVRRRHPSTRFADTWVYPAQSFEVVEVALPERAELNRLEFEDPLLPERYPSAAAVEERQERRFVVGKTGGPYLRSSYLRGPVRWLMDLAEDPGFARELAMRVADHLVQVGLEMLRRYRLHDTAMWLDDDIGTNQGTVFSPAVFEKVFLPCYRMMVGAYRAAGVRTVIFHSDGNIENVLDMLVDAGISALNPLEYKAGMDAVRLRERYGRKLAFIGGLDNAHTLPEGTPAGIEAHVRRLLSIGEEGGLVAGSHSIGADVPVQNYELAWRLIRDAAGDEAEGPLQ